ncbi:MAG: M1 family metallopeptidase, partial [Bacteroidota bacterium]
MKAHTFLLFLFFLWFNIYSQDKELYLPLEYQKSYKNNTRSFSGNPGENYWQNKAVYNIEVEYNPATRKVKGKSNIVYKNNSPDQIFNIVLSNKQNLFKNGNIRDKSVDARDINDGVQIENIYINNEKNELPDSLIEQSGTLMTIFLPFYLMPSETIEFDIAWSYILPLYTKIRTGVVDSNSAFIAYWFPQIAIYDDISGWDMLQYDGFHEPNNEFSDFNVKIKVPDNYLVWATGTLQNYSELLNDKFLSRYKQAIISDSISHIIRANEINEKISKNNPANENVWHFKAENISDFAFAVSKKSCWDITTIENNQNERTIIQSVYKPKSKYFTEAVELGKKTIEYLSEDYPAINYPFQQMTIFNGFGGMEFPMITNIRDCESRTELVFVISHEITHNYFPFYVGTNSMKYAWMDELWAMFLPKEFQLNEDTGCYSPANSVFCLSEYSGTSMNTPLMTPSVYMMGYEAAISSYYQPEMAFYFLRDIIGKETFEKALKEFINNWKYKHPSPYDLFYTFNRVSGKDLNWYWNDWFFEFGHPDLAINNVELIDKKLNIKIENKGKLPLPVSLTIVLKNDTIIRYETAEI